MTVKFFKGSHQVVRGLAMIFLAATARRQGGVVVVVLIKNSKRCVTLVGYRWHEEKACG